MSKNRLNKTNYTKPIEFLKRQFNQLALSNLDKGNELTSKQMIGYVQSIYAQLQMLQQILQLDLNKQNEDLAVNNDIEYHSNKYVDDICINLNFALNSMVSLYEITNKKEILETINSIRNYLEEVTIDLDLLELDINPQTFRKIKRKSKTK